MGLSGSTSSPPPWEPDPVSTPTPTDEGVDLGPPDGSTNALRDDLDEPILSEIDSGADQLLSTAAPDGLSDPYSSAQDGWNFGSQEIDPYTSEAATGVILCPFVGQDVDPYTNSAASEANPNAFTGDQNVNPFTGLQNSDWFNGGGSAANPSPMLNFNIGLSTTSDDSSAPQPVLASNNYDITVFANAPSGGEEIHGTESGGEEIHGTESDYAQGEMTRKQDPLNPEGQFINWLPTQVIVSNTAASAPSNKAQSQTPPYDPSPAATQTPQPAPPAPPTGAPPTPAPSAPPTAFSPPVPVLPTPAAASGEVDASTVTEWAFPKPDPRLIQPLTSFDSGNRPLNFVLNKVLLPWRNAAAFLENIPLAVAIGVDDALKHSAVRMEYQAAQDMMPLEGAMGLAAEVGPALDYAVTSIATNQRLRGVITAPAYWFVGAGGVGGGISATPRAARSALKAADELPALGAEIRASLSSTNAATRAEGRWINIARPDSESMFQQAVWSGRSYDYSKGGSIIVQEYRLGNVNFDGASFDASGALKSLDEFKWDYSGSIASGNVGVANSLVRQATEQLNVAEEVGVPLNWHVQEAQEYAFRNALGALADVINFITYHPGQP